MTAKHMILLPERPPLIQVNCIRPEYDLMRGVSSEVIARRKTQCQSAPGLGAGASIDESCDRCTVVRRECWDGSIPKFR
jgi:hypothetical protein